MGVLFLRRLNSGRQIWERISVNIFGFGTRMSRVPLTRTVFLFKLDLD
jgi:hypothetical protein